MDQSLEYVQRELETQCANYTESLSNGTAHDYAEYQHVCGMVRGLRTAIAIITDLATRMETEDE